MSSTNISGISEGLSESIDKSRRKDAPIKPSSSIAVSISESEDAASFGFTQWHLQDAMIEVSRYLLVHNCRIMYGGDLRKNGFTDIFSNLVKQYTANNEGSEMRAINYFPWPIHLQLTRMMESEFKANGLDIRKVPLPAGIDVGQDVYLKPDLVTNQVIWAKSLSFMRQQLSREADATIVMGGRVSHFVGKMPGVLEEILTNITAAKPIYIAGAFGGIAKAIAEVLKNEENEIITESFQLRNTLYAEFYEYWNSIEEEKISYAGCRKQIENYGVKGLSEMNGLSEKENLRLFETPHIPEMTQLILKGLSNIGLI